MKFPNKINAYKETVIYAMPIIYELSAKTGDVISLMRMANNKGIDAATFLDAICCLFALNKIKIGKNKGEVERC